ncbi:MAG TPA: hypothetical protein VHM20_05750, partial [Gammaproteobacteria bacterium]|nr:hypothetical protein [Gammaproteobacteria bacterium]
MLSNFDSFDAGPMWQWNDGINENDFKNCIIDSESERFLKITIERNIEDQRFAIYGIVVQYSDKPSEFYVFFQPSLPSDNFFIEAKLDKTRFLKNLEGIFGTGKIVHPSDRKYPGVVHWQTKEIRMNSNFVQQNPALLRAIQQEKSFQMGFSCTYKKGRFIFMGRSTLNLSIYTFLNSAKYTLRFSHSPDSQEQQYDNEKKDFYGRKYNDLYHRHRESPPIPLTVIITTINQRLIMAMPNNSPPDGRWGESDSD